ncbi:MAG: hypothetical protein Q8L48_43050 [Archangium sp.]|nr:hypothetical protein [Archangium sp.]
MLRTLLTIILLSVILLAASPASACECKQSSPARTFETADAVFEATTLEPIAWPADGDGTVRVTVGRRWKGVEPSSTGLELHVTRGKSCGYQFKAKTSYLVFATKKGEVLWVSLCSATQPLADAKATLEKLPPPAP